MGRQVDRKRNDPVDMAESRLLLERIGARIEPPVDPSQLMVWSPREVERWQSWLETGEWLDLEGGGSCVGETQAGQRGVIYQSDADQGLVAFFDFSSDAVRSTRLQSVAYGLMRPFPHVVPRADLLLDPVLGPVFSSRMARRSLSAAQGARVSELVNEPVPFGRLPSLGEVPPDYFSMGQARESSDFVLESEMEAAIRRSRRAWRRIFRTRPTRQVRSESGQDRYDLVAGNVVAELKLRGDLQTLRQLERYLDTLQRERRDHFTGHIVVGNWASPRLRKAVAEHPQVEGLWQASRGRLGVKLRRLD